MEKKSPNAEKSGSYDPKATNPKDAIGGSKLPLDLVPDTGIAYAALAFLEGALKYGKFNWRISGVRWSVYESALKRHMIKVKEGEWNDPVTGVPHIGSMLACLMIAADAYENGMMIDDRPPSMNDASHFIDYMPNKVARLKEVFAKYDPKQYTIRDTNVKWTGDAADTRSFQKASPGPAPRENVQPIQGRNGGHVVQRGEIRHMDRVEMAGEDSNTYDCGDPSCPVCPTSRLAGSTKEGRS